MILAHAKAYRTYESTYKAEQNGEISITLNAFWGEPRDENSEDDILAAQVSIDANYYYVINYVIHFNLSSATWFIKLLTGLIRYTLVTIPKK